MVGIAWSEEQKRHEWAIAKQKLTHPDGQLRPNGTKISRKLSGLHHSFMVIDNKILALDEQGAHLGEGKFGQTKLAEDEQGHLYALKISLGDNLATEADISADLHIAGRATTRQRAQAENKHYLAYRYLGTRFDEYFIARRKTLSLDERYELCTKIALALHALQTGRHSKTNTAYKHSDFHAGNILIDEHGNMNIIDFGLAHESEKINRSNEDTLKMLNYFYVSAQKRTSDFDDNPNIQPFFGVLGDVMPCEYRVYEYRPRALLSPNELVLTQHPSYLHDGKYTKIGYKLLDSQGELKTGTIELSQIDMMPFSWKLGAAVDDDGIFEQLLQRKNKILDLIVAEHGDVIDHPKQNELLFNRLNNRQSTAFEIAETLTLCRFNLETYQPWIEERSADERLLAIKILHAQSQLIFELYEQIRLTPHVQAARHLENRVKQWLVNQVFSQKSKTNMASFNTCIQKKICNLVEKIEEEKKLIAHASAFNALVDSILVLKKHSSPGVQDKLDALNSDLYEAGRVFFNQKYKNSEDRLAALSVFKKTCEILISEAETLFLDNPSLWAKLDLGLRQIPGVILAIGTLGSAVYLFGGLDTYKARFFNPLPSWQNIRIKDRLFATKEQEQRGLLTQIEEDILIKPKKI